jgi:hypothetical protein
MRLHFVSQYRKSYIENPVRVLGAWCSYSPASFYTLSPSYPQPLLFDCFCVRFRSFDEGDGVQPLWGLSGYLAFLFDLMLETGIMFQLPLALLAFLISRAVSPELIAHYRPHCVLMIFLLAPPSPLRTSYHRSCWASRFICSLRGPWLLGRR